MRAERTGARTPWTGRTAAARALLDFMERVCICVACILLMLAECLGEK